jgi:hypothetical protein
MRNDLVTPVHRYLHSPATRDLTKFFEIPCGRSTTDTTSCGREAKGQANARTEGRRERRF